MPESTEPDQPAESYIQLTVVLPEKPGRITFPVSSYENILEVSQTLNAIPSTKQYTSFSLEYDGKKLPESSTVSEFLEDNNDKLTFTLKQAPYTEKSARDHVLKVREMASLELPSFYGSLHDFSGVSAGASTYESLELDEVKEEEVKEPEEEEEEKKKTDAESDDTPASESDKSTPPIEISDQEKAYIHNRLDAIIKEKANVSEFAGEPTLKLSPALKSLYISSWTPASQSRKLKGDLFYVHLQTLEGETFHITAHVSGFFVNQCSGNRFDGRPRTLPKKISRAHSLISLINALSPKFSEQLQANDELLSKKLPETFLLPVNSLLSNPWLVKSSEREVSDLARTQETYLYGGLDGADLQKDWNEEFQELRELAKPDLQETITREQLLNKTTFNFSVSAIQGAVAVVNGEITPMNPEDDPSQFIYLRNGIFYSYPVDSTGQFAHSGGDEAARSAAGRDLAGVNCLNRLDVSDVSQLMTTIVDYYGHRVICQTPVPGIFNTKEPEAEKKAEAEEQTPSSTSTPPVTAPSIVVYGVSEGGERLDTDESVLKKFTPIGEAFHLKPHKVWNSDGSSVVDAVTSIQTKGLHGSDGRTYIVDLYRTTPLDIEFIEENYDPSKPDSYPHSEVTLRHEAVEEWWRRQVSVAVKAETDKLEKEKKEKGEEAASEEVKPTIGIDSISFSLNPDAFSLPKAPTEELAKDLLADEDRVREASKFVSEVLISELLSDLEKSDVYTPFDGEHLTSMLHKQGINLRYLGSIAEDSLERKADYLKKEAAKRIEIAKGNEVIAVKEEEKEAALRTKIEARTKAAQEAVAKGEKPPPQIEETEEEKKIREEEEKNYTNNVESTDVAAVMNALYVVTLHEMVARATKHFLRKQLTSLPLCLAPYAIVHVHNCLLLPEGVASPEAPVLDSLLAEIYGDLLIPVLSKSADEIRAAIAKEVYARFRYHLPSDWPKLLKPVPLVKRIATKVGIQWQSKSYALTKEDLEKQKAEAAAVIASADEEAKKASKKLRKNRSHSPSTPEPAPKPVSTTFSPSDIVALVPVIKDSVYESVTVDQIWETGKSQIASGKTEEGVGLLNEAVRVYEQIYGTVHPETARAYSQLAEICSSLKLHSQAVRLGRRAFQLLERTTGTDSYETVLALSRLAFYEAGNHQYVDSLKVSRRVLNHWLVAYGESHPSTVNTVSSIAILMQRLKLSDEAVKVFTRAIELSDAAHGANSQVTGLLRFQLAQSLMNVSRFEDAAEQCQKAFEIFEPAVGLNDVSTREARKWAAGITNYLAISKREKQYFEEVEAQKVKQAKQAKQAQQAKQVKQVNRASPSNGGGKKHSDKVESVPEIAGQSIDDIMSYINSGSTPRKGKKKHERKH
ncbi:DEKNAAC102080 [Brettanomyces naardenensis]|uniref:DEKNAAC102080 n=1 Tax=Brettanomyces naardenensis TaxID=13370 RepID=A0A448YJQ6_BRENA|nr:DEKNAAC102080 [Brettanomyces naardenensis]